MKLAYDNGVTSGVVDTEVRPPFLPKRTPMDVVAELFSTSDSIVTIIVVDDDGSTTTVKRVHDG